MRRHIYLIVSVLLMLFSLAGCKPGAVSAQAIVGAGANEHPPISPLRANPQAAIDEIYELYPDTIERRLSEQQFKDLFPELDGVVTSFYGGISEPAGGVADILIFRPPVDNGNSAAIRDLVSGSLRQYQEKRIREFENYDIFESFSIATGAVVYDQGDFVIMLMLSDNELGRDIIDKHIPR